jgi:acyl carrier protein
VDREALPPPTRGVAIELIEPRTSVEREVAALFTEVLHLNPIGVTEDFFELGGSSLLMAMLTARLADAYALDLSMLQVIEEPSVASIAAMVELYQREGRDAVMARSAARVEVDTWLDPSVTPDWSAEPSDARPAAPDAAGARSVQGVLL